MSADNTINIGAPIRLRAVKTKQENARRIFIFVFRLYCAIVYAAANRKDAEVALTAVSALNTGPYWGRN
jgi:hypothetical protein